MIRARYRTAGCVLALAITCVAPACNSAPTCQPASVEYVDAIAEGLLDDASGLDGAMQVVVPGDKRSSTGYPTVLVGARVQGGRADGEVAVFALKGGSSIGPIDAITSGAQRSTSWGDAAQPGSQAAENREHIAGFEEVAAVEACVPNARA